MKVTKRGLCMSVRGLLRNRGYVGLFKNEQGQSIGPDEAFEYICDELAKGHEQLPLSPKCGNPCSQAGCKGFDYGKDGGCPGYEVETEVEERDAAGS